MRTLTINVIFLLSPILASTAFGSGLEKIVAIQQAQLENLKPKIYHSKNPSVRSVDPVSSTLEVGPDAALTIQKIGIMCTAIIQFKVLSHRGAVYSIGIEVEPENFRPVVNGMNSAAVYADWSGTQFYHIYSRGNFLNIYRNSKDVPVSFTANQEVSISYNYQCGTV